MKVAILSGSVYGTAEEVARHAERQLKAAGLDAWHKSNMSLEELLAFAPDAFLTVTSTTGMGELPDNLLPLYSEIRDRLPAWSGKPAAVLGDTRELDRALLRLAKAGPDGVGKSSEAERPCGDQAPPRR